MKKRTTHILLQIAKQTRQNYIMCLLAVVVVRYYDADSQWFFPLNNFFSHKDNKLKLNKEVAWLAKDS